MNLHAMLCFPKFAVDSDLHIAVIKSSAQRKLEIYK